ncbi:calcium-binding protein [Pseudodonghicola flavimaris]|uniref:Calcium-binding protein n=1 Tax=Pseudodonghicola flavimaris TaxID=3050036 RepID=A0ABT7F505_9RHOB|nr:calcium-binding protein [Pseudodonghicola flavimaris]MDK3019693.1 calcium-binding protein [Pseudodonghicola flavimaris]
MAVVSFSPYLPIYEELTSNLGTLLKIDGPLSADDGTIIAMTSASYGSELSHDGLQWTQLEIRLDGSFSYGPLATVAGTVTGVTVMLEGETFATISGLTGDASRIWAGMIGGRAPLLAILTGDDDIDGTDGINRIHGYKGDDVIRGFGDHDTIYGDGGQDWIYGGAGQDYIKSGLGDDHVFGGIGHDDLYGGSGNDVLRGAGGNDYVGGGNGDDRLFGGTGADHLVGGEGDDWMDGGAGNDFLHGDSGADLLFGGLGRDTINSGDGDDVISGGADADRFIFYDFGENAASGADVITDFEAGEVIRLGRVADPDMVVITQAGDDVLIALSDETLGNSITVLNALVTDVSGATETTSWYAFS